MTVTDEPTSTYIQPVAFDLYRDIHKGIRTELFALTTEAGSLDPGDAGGRAALAAHVDGTVAFLVDHARHEDDFVQPAIVEHLPILAEQIEAEHVVLEARMLELQELARHTAAASAVEQRGWLGRLYLELASFTSAYLEHQDVEERRVMPELEAAIGLDAVLEINGALIGSIPPQDMATGLSLMLPAMNIDDRAEMLGGMRANAPAEVFAGVWSLAGSVLHPADVTALAARLGLG